MVKVLITGGNGFIARNLYEQLSNSYNITSLSSKELNLLDTELVYNYLKVQRFDVVIHTATYDPAPKYSTKDPAKVLEYNLKMFFNIARCSGYFGKMLYFGSGAEFDREHWIPKMKEDYFDRYVPVDQYGFSKYIMTKYTELSDNIYNLRVFAVFGKYEDWRYRFISRACCCAIFDKPVTVNQNVFFDYIYVDDFAKITKWFIDNTPKTKVYNICSSVVYEYNTLVKKITKITGKNLELIIKAEGFRKEYSGNNELLFHEIPDLQFSPIDDSIEKLYSWYLGNRSIIDKNEL